MERSSRYKHILETLEASTVPVKGQTLAAETGVSRQMIVKDVDELRERGYRIVST
ncbi:transcriptional regulator, partial [Mesotoga sp. SC_3PWM13N19]